MSELRLNYRVEGDGDPLLLVHGFGISFPIWEELLPLLKPHFKLVMIELPGVGETPMPSDGDDYLAACLDGMERVRQQLRIERWNVLGYSTGTRIAEAYVQAHAAQVCSAVFLCPLRMGRSKLGALRLGLRLDAWRPAIGSWILGGWRLRTLISWLGFNLRPDPRSGQWYQLISAVPIRVLKETIRAVAATSGGGFSVPVPSFFIWGDRDLVPRKPRHPGAQDRLVHGRHAAPVESAAEVADAVIDVLGER